MDEVAVVQGLLDGKATVNTYLATFVSFARDRMQFDIGPERIDARAMTAYRPEVNEPVWIVAINGRFYFIGSALSKPGQGEVLDVVDGRAIVGTDIGDVSATIAEGIELVPGSIVTLYWQGGATVMNVLSSPPPVVEPPPAQTAGPTQHVDTFLALDAGTFGGGNWKQRQVWASASTLGAWFYGTKIVDTLRAAQVQRIEIYCTLAQVFGDAPVFATHPHPSQPPGAPSLSNSTARQVSSGIWLELPVAFGQWLAANVGGIGLNHGGFNKFRSLTEDPQSGALRITSIY
ncbi:hypothetical protein ABID92_000422 [Frigoribacterium sp. PvP120]|uniref:hypothetical protein n=1 Tax=unclassified Frigoribacterium TaxID=2627005 RepID=UPI001AE881FE|nr:hypothetical protein [Frigoribacterium sp. PvP121]MBP1241750.1 hypothetical protein [Frigoribacterium sp. PvP121]